jgi:hypothetical protein
MKIELQYQGSPMTIKVDAKPFDDKRVLEALQCALSDDIESGKKLLNVAGYPNGFIAGVVFVSKCDEKSILSKFARINVDLAQV